MKTIRHAFLMFIVLAILTGVMYPMVMIGIGRWLFPETANGSLIKKNGAVFGSALIGRNFTGNRYFHPRPSATGYDPLFSGGSNLSASSLALADLVALRRTAFRRDNFLDTALPVPSEMLFASGSGLDPDISAESALLQLARVSVARQLTPEQVLGIRAVIADLARSPKSSILFTTRVNTLLLNLALDSLTGSQ